MSSFTMTLANIFGPWIQLLLFLCTLFTVAGAIGAIAFWCERMLIRTKKRILWLLPFPLLFLYLFYGALRVSGLLLYPTDGWDPWGIWNYTNQNQGTYIIFLCGCLLIGATLAIHKEKRNPNHENGIV